MRGRPIRLILLALSGLNAQDPMFKVDVKIVRVTAAVRDALGHPVRDVRREEFRILDNQRSQEARYLWRENLPLAVGLVLDVSSSQLPVLRENKKHVHEFLKRVLRKQDTAFLTVFGGQTRLAHDWTGSADELARVIDNLDPKAPDLGQPLGAPCVAEGKARPGDAPVTCGGSLVWNAVYWSAKKLEERDGRRAMLLISDGIDSGSDRSFGDAITEAQTAGAVVYTLGLTNRKQRVVNRNHMRSLARETGGMAFIEGEPARTIFPAIDEDVRSLYLLGFSPAFPCDGNFHYLAVTARAGLTTRARSGYIATCAR